MKKFTALTSLLILGTTLSYIVNSTIHANAIQAPLGEEDFPLYL